MRKLIVLFIGAALMAACSAMKSIEVEIPVYVHDTVSAVEVRVDSVEVVRYRYEKEKGDTVYVFDSVVREKRVMVHDSTYRYIEIPVEVEKEVTVEVVKEVPRERTFFEKTLLGLGVLCVICSIAGIVYIIWRRKSK